MSRYEVLSTEAALALGDAKSRQCYRLILVDVAIDYFTAHATQTWASLRFVEFTPLFVLKRRGIKGTIFEPLADILRRHAHPIDGTLGDIMHVIGLNRQNVHYLACHCLGASISGREAAKRLNFYAQYHLRFQ